LRRSTSSARDPRQRVQLPSPAIVRSIDGLRPTNAGIRPSRAAIAYVNIEPVAVGLDVELGRQPVAVEHASCSPTIARPARISASPCRLPVRAVPLTRAPTQPIDP
jgi:hypothetical protein